MLDEFHCKRFKVGDQEEWIAEHSQHGELDEQLNEHQPPSYRLVSIVCLCGARFIYSRELNEKELRELPRDQFLRLCATDDDPLFYCDECEWYGLQSELQAVNSAGSAILVCPQCEGGSVSPDKERTIRS